LRYGNDDLSLEKNKEKKRKMKKKHNNINKQQQQKKQHRIALGNLHEEMNDKIRRWGSFK